MWRLDDKVIEVCEAVSHFTQLWFGLTSVTWERLLLALSILILIIVETPNDLERGKNWLALMNVILVWDRAMRFRETYRREKEVEFLNTKKQEEYTLRIICLVFLILTYLLLLPIPTYDLLWWFQFYVFSLYFAACNDLPPGESRKKWKALKKSLSKTMVPVPVGS